MNSCNNIRIYLQDPDCIAGLILLQDMNPSNQFDFIGSLQTFLIKKDHGSTDLVTTFETC